MLKKNEIFALDQFTCSFPDGKSFESILELIKNQDESVVIWQPFEDDVPESVIEKITDQLIALDSVYPQENVDNIITNAVTEINKIFNEPLDGDATEEISKSFLRILDIYNGNK